jgi:predicted nucleic acid-binding protein
MTVEADETYFGKTEVQPTMRADGKPYKYKSGRKAGHCRLYTSTITLAEITKLNLKSPEYGTFSEFLGNFRSVVIPVDPNPQAMLRASHLRRMIYTKTTGKRKLATPDAIHIATALALCDAFGVTLDAFRTFDGGKGRGGADGPACRSWDMRNGVNNAATTRW